MFTSQGFQCGDTVTYFQVFLTFTKKKKKKKNLVKGSGDMTNNFLKQLNIPVFIHMFILV